MSSIVSLLVVALMVLPLIAALIFVIRIRARLGSAMVDSQKLVVNLNMRPSLDARNFSLQTSYQSKTLTWHASVQNGDQQLEFDHPSELIGYLEDFDGEVAKTALENTRKQLKTILEDVQKKS
jgi:hypothetical protein